MTNRMRVAVMAAGCGLAVLAVQTAMAQAPESVDELVAMMASDDGEERVEARNHAADFGPEAVAPLAALFDHDDRNVYLAAKWSLRSIVHDSTLPREDEDEAQTAQRAIAQAVVELLDADQPERVSREAFYLLGLCGGEQEIPAIAAWLDDPDKVDQASAALVRIPGEAGLEAMLDAVEDAEGEIAVYLIHAIAQEEAPAAREQLETLAESDDEIVAEAAAKALSIRDLRVDYDG